MPLSPLTLTHQVCRAKGEMLLQILFWALLSSPSCIDALWWWSWTASEPTHPYKPTSNSLSHLPYGGLDATLIEKVKERYKFLSSQSQRPHPFSSCWTDAFAELGLSCRAMEPTSKQALALKLTECHLMEARRPLTRCQRDDVSFCLQLLDEATFAIYTDFFTHVDSACFYLQNDLWQTGVEATINSLTETSQSMVSLLGETSLIQQDILVKQQESLEHQLQLKDSQSTLQAGIDISVSSVGQLNMKIEHSALKQQELMEVISNARKDFSELLHMMEDRTKVDEKRFQILHESLRYTENAVSGISMAWKVAKTFWFFIVSINLGWVLTSIPETTRARGPIFIVLALECGLEAGISYTIPEYIVTTPIIAWARSVAISTCSLLLIYALLFSLISKFGRHHRRSRQGSRAWDHNKEQEPNVQYDMTQNRANDNDSASHNFSDDEASTTSISVFSRRKSKPRNWTEEELMRLPRRKLQQMAKDRGACKGNLATEQIIQALLETE